MKSRKIRLQSAMEYLMTYGWAILIIAVVLGALFQLGIFNSPNFAPRAPPGSCKVFRTAGTTNLEGVCSGQLPQFVASLDGVNGYNQLPSYTSLPGSHTVSFWLYVSQISSADMVGIVSNQNNNNNYGTEVEYSAPNLYFIVFWTGPPTWGTVTSTTSSASVGVWTYWTFVMTGSSGSYSYYFYKNGNLYASATSQTVSMSNWGKFLAVGGRACSPCSSTGHPYELANVQIYNTSLDAGSIQSLYLEGIGGAPVSPQYLVGWWPLNGDTNDYSGNNNGQATGISFLNQWLSGYTPP